MPIHTEPGEQEIWPALADLFFLDTAVPSQQLRQVAQLLNDRGWSRQQVERTLVELVAPIAGANLGYLIYPSYGEWAGFDPDWLNERIGRRVRLRARLPRWRFWLSDFWCRRMLIQLRWERLLRLLP
jgi:hypothetical protein